MDSLLNVALTRYFDSLSTYGYHAYPDTYKVVLATYINRMLGISDLLFLKPEEILILKRTVMNMIGTSCLFPIGQSLTNSSSSSSSSLVYYGEMLGTPDIYNLKNGYSKRISDLQNLQFEITWKSFTTQYIAVPSSYKVKSIINDSVAGTDDDIWYDDDNKSLYSTTQIIISSVTYNVYYATRLYPMEATATVTLQKI